MEQFCFVRPVFLALCAIVTLSFAAIELPWVQAAPSSPEQALTRVAHHSEQEYDAACRALPQFCREWKQKLDDRVKDQANLMEWQDRDGWKTATYLGYGPIESCACKIMDGVPIGELTYRAIEYYIAGHTVEEAKHAPPIVAGSTKTTEIFRWQDGRWSYQ